MEVAARYADIGNLPIFLLNSLLLLSRNLKIYAVKRVEKQRCKQNYEIN